MKSETTIEELTELAYQRHKTEFGEWREGKPVKSWYDDDGNICVEYESGKWWHYKDLDLPFPTFW